MKRRTYPWCAIAMCLLIVSATHALPTEQTFDGGGTNFTLTQHNSAPAPVVTASGPTGAFLRLANDSVKDNQNTIGFDRTHIDDFEQVTGHFDFRIGEGAVGDGADGLGFALLNTADFGTSGAAPVFSEEPNLPNSFGIGLDIHDNGIKNGVGDISGNEVSLHFNGASVAQFDLTGLMDLENSLFNRLSFVINPTAGGSHVSLSNTPDVHGSPGTSVTVFDQLFVAGLNPYESRAAFAARTGGLNHNHDIDNVLIKFINIPEPTTAILALLGAAALIQRRQTRLGC